MFSFFSSKRSRRPMHLTRPKGRPAATIEGLEGRLLFTFNAYIAGLRSGAPDADASFVVSTTGQAAKQWVIDWGDLSTPTTLTAPDPNIGFTSPQTVTHHYGLLQANYNVTGTATSTTNVTATGVPLGENSAFGNGGGTGKEVQGLPDGSTTLTNIAAVVDENNNTYVASIDGKRMAVTRFKPDGTLDTTSSWKSTGTYILDPITTTTNQDTPKAMTIDKTNGYIYLAGTSGSKWAAARVNYNFINTTPEGWHWADLNGTPNGIWLDSTDRDKIGMAGNNTSAELQVQVLWARDSFGHTGGTPVTSFGSNGVATAPNSLYGITAGYSVTASGAALVEGDDIFQEGVGSLGGEEEWFVSGTITYCCINSIPTSGSDMVIVDFLSDGSIDTSFGNRNGAALLNTYNNCVMGSGHDTNYAMVAYFVNDTPYMTLVGAADHPSNPTVLTERYTADGLLDTAGYGPLSGGTRPGYAYGPGGTAYAAVLDPSVNKVVISGSGGTSDFLAARFNDDGALDTTFGSGGSIKIDFGSTSGITTDGARAIATRVVDGVVDILVGGYTFDASTSKYKIALVDLLDDNMFHVT